MSASNQYQAIVIGSGQGGTPLGMALARAGLRTALIERKHVGGTCVNEGCTPTKTIRVARMPMTYVARALEVDETRGFMKAVVDAGTGQILGAAVFGLEGGEIMSMLQLAMMGKLTYPILRDAVFAHPTLAESLNNLFTHFVV